MQHMQQRTPSGAATADDVERALADWLDEQSAGRAGLSAWESHCFALVLTFLRYGYYDRALDQIAFILEPPTPLPIFPMHHLISLEQLLRALPRSVHDRRRASPSPSSRSHEGADPSD